MLAKRDVGVVGFEVAAGSLEPAGAAGGGGALPATAVTSPDTLAFGSMPAVRPAFKANVLAAAPPVAGAVISWRAAAPMVV